MTSIRLIRTAVLSALAAIVAIATMAVPARPAAAAESNFVPGTSYYLGLGDSWGKGEAPALYDVLRSSNPSLGFVNLACGGENSYGFITPGTSKAWLGEHLHDGGCSNTPSRSEYSSLAADHSSQMSAAIDFITSHPGQVRFISLSIGGNDAGSPGISTGSNIVSAVRQLRAAAGPDAIIVGQNAVDFGLQQWLSGASGQAAAQASVATTKSVNDWIAARFAEGGANATADVATAFNTYVPFTTTASWNGQTVPLAVATLCANTRLCTENNGHPNSAGNALIANQYANQVLGSTPIIPPPSSVPPVPTTTPATPSNVQVYGATRAKLEITWNTPPSSSAYVAGYRIEQSVGDGPWTVVVPDTGNAATRATMSSLTDGVTNRYRVLALNARGLSSPSAASNPASSPTTPTAPTSVASTLANVGGVPTVTVSWQPPSSTGGSPITEYQLDRSTNNGQTWVSQKGLLDPTTRSWKISGITPGKYYIYRVTANTAIDWSPPSASTTPVVVPTAPSSPTGLTATASTGGATVSWTAPSDGGSPITSYSIEAANKSVTPREWKPVATASPQPGTAQSLLVTDLSSGVRYVFRVTARNALGPSAPSGETPSAVTLSTSPTSLTKQS